jgi:hypothetical protein
MFLKFRVGQIILQLSDWNMENYLANVAIHGPGSLVWLVGSPINLFSKSSPAPY